MAIYGLDSAPIRRSAPVDALRGAREMLMRALEQLNRELLKDESTQPLQDRHRHPSRRGDRRHDGAAEVEDHRRIGDTVNT